MFEMFSVIPKHGWELPIGRMLLVVVFAPLIYLPSDVMNEEVYVGLVFGLASGLAAWVVFSPVAGWKRRLSIAFAITTTCGMAYAMGSGLTNWLPLAAVVGTYVNAALVLSLVVFLLFRWGLKRDRITNKLQFGVKHLLGATLVVIPLSVMIRLAMPELNADIEPIAILAGNALLICLAAQWLLGPRHLTAGELAGRTALLVMIILGLGIAVPQLPITQFHSPSWSGLQFMLGATIIAGYLLPRLDHLVVRTHRPEHVEQESIESGKATQHESETTEESETQ